MAYFGKGQDLRTSLVLAILVVGVLGTVAALSIVGTEPLEDADGRMPEEIEREPIAKVEVRPQPKVPARQRSRAVVPPVETPQTDPVKSYWLDQFIPEGTEISPELQKLREKAEWVRSEVERCRGEPTNPESLKVAVAARGDQLLEEIQKAVLEMTAKR